MMKLNKAILRLLLCVGFVGASTVLMASDSISYIGQDLNAEWRLLAKQRIEKYRKANLSVTVLDKDGNEINGAHIHFKMIKHAFGFGSAVWPKLLMGTSKDCESYRDIVINHYNKVVLENDLKWDQWNQSKTNPPSHGYYYPRTFTALEWLKDHNIGVRGHYVSWGPVETLEAYKKFRENPLKFRQVLFEHIKEEVSTVGNLVEEWDVVNHPIGWNERLITLADIFGQNVYIDIFKLVREINSQAHLYINEGNVLPVGKYRELMRNKYEKLIRYLLENKAQIDGIGFMGHFNNKNLTPPEDLYRILNRFAALGLPLQVTEFDVRFGEYNEFYNFSKKDLQLQADYTRDFMTVMFSHPSVVGIVMWGFWEGRQHQISAALYRKNWSIKLNGEAWNHLVFDKWWTDEHGHSDKNGKFQTRGFLGDYEIAVEYDGKKNVKSFKLTKENLDEKIIIPIRSKLHGKYPSALSSVKTFNSYK